MENKMFTKENIIESFKASFFIVAAMMVVATSLQVFDIQSDSDIVLLDGFVMIGFTLIALGLTNFNVVKSSKANTVTLVAWILFFVAHLFVAELALLASVFLIARMAVLIEKTNFKENILTMLENQIELAKF